MSLHGDFVSEDTETLRREAGERLQSSTHDFVLDLSKTEFIDSMGLETLIWLQEQCVDRLGQIHLAGCAENVIKILEITRLASRFDCHEDVESAISQLGSI